jgi:glycosyltransferase involved in cell wall biosynthesis
MRRVLFVGRTRYQSPLAPSHARKFAALAGVFEFHVIGSAVARGPAPDRFTLIQHARVLDGPVFYLRLPFLVAQELRRFRPDAVIAQSPYEGLAALAGRRLARSHAKVIVEIHGDWTTATRLYGSPGRAVLAPITDRLASYAIRRADAVRTVSEFTARCVRSLGVEPAAVFQAYTEFGTFTEREPESLPAKPHFAFIGVLERYKNIDGLVGAWRRAASQLPGVTLELVGRGRRVAVVERLVQDTPAATVWHPRLEPPAIADLLDRSWALVLPSFSEGLPRVVIEAFARGRPVIGSKAGGIPDAVVDSVNGLLVPPGDEEALADAIVRLAGDRLLAERLASGARASAASLLAPPEAFAEHFAVLVEQTVS